MTEGNPRGTGGTAVRIAAALLAVALPAQADETAIRKALEPTLGRIDTVAKSPVDGVWEVVAGAKMQYTDALGMTGEADIATGRKSVMQWLLKPVFLASDTAFHER